MALPAEKSEALLEKIRSLAPDELAEVEDFIEFLREKQRRKATTPESRLRAAVDAGHIIAPRPGYERSSVIDVPPIVVPGTPPSEIVLEDRR